ncbi:MAG: penicillin-binding transpeptidase domain-containing protein [Eubacteriales bacterium]
MREKARNIRGIITICLIFGVFAAFGLALMKMQVIDGKLYAAKGNSMYVKTVSIKAARGEILDRNGNPLITNRQGNSVIFESAFFPSAKELTQRDKIIISLIRIFEVKKKPWIDNLPLEFSKKGVIVFKEKREHDIAQMKSKDMLNLNEYASAQNCFDALIKRYQLGNYSKQDARKIASVSYEMKSLNFSISNPYTFAEDVSGEIVAKIKENSNFYKGVNVQIVPYREYADGLLAPHILGMVGAISPEEYAKLKDSGYKLNDTIGKNGIEGAMEKYLRGKDGVKTVSTDSNGNITSEVTTPPVQGNTIVLTIDAKLQKVTQDALREVLLAQKKIVQTAGAAIVINVNTGEILASASYPTYDISTYNKDYSKLAKTPGAPLWDRALLSSYEAGSTMKPSVAIAALEEGVINKSSTVYCDGTYEYNKSVYLCRQAHANRNVNVVAALKESCNYFFYEMGVRLGISKINEYRTLLGLGQKTGVELNEATGLIDSPDYRTSLGQVWQPGFTVQSAIGQAGNLFTPIQLVNYCATIANGGTRYQPHFVKTVKAYDFSKTVLEKKPFVTCDTGFSKDTLSIVREGMFLVGSEGYCRRVFAKLPVAAAAKTGTSQVAKNINGVSTIINNGFVISYAPAEKPEIAVCVVGEGFPNGTSIAPVAARIYAYYFANSKNVESPQAENSLL